MGGERWRIALWSFKKSLPVRSTYCSIVPDVAVFQWGRIPRRADSRVENAFTIAPDWTIEILSPNQSHTRVVRNIFHCLEYGAEMGWLLAPEEACVFAYDAGQSVKMVEASDDVVLPVPAITAKIRLIIKLNYRCESLSPVSVPEPHSAEDIDYLLFCIRRSLCPDRNFTYSTYI
ncbi:MAG: hypothetical protein F6K09_13140 [Merismopedia sp. SIO2A8]|nr:hypothetical protein [Merismopedia sp. SIO2A8]